MKTVLNFQRIRTVHFLFFQIQFLALLSLFTDYTSAIEFNENLKDVSNIIGKESLFYPHVRPHLPNGKTTYPVDTQNLVILTESTPVKDSILYGDVLSYKFEPSLDSEWTHSYQIIVYISASLCQLPENWNTNTSDNGLSLYYTFNKTVAEEGFISQMTTIQFQNGYAQGLAEIQVQNDVSDYNLYLTVIPDDCTNCTNTSTWVFEFGVSQKQLLFLYDTDPYISVVDVDYDSVIFEAGGISFNSNRTYGMYIFEDDDPISIALNQSWCAVSESDNYTMKVDILENNTLSTENTFIVSGLELSTRYSAILFVTFTDVPYGGGVFHQYGFTMSTSKACKLAYNLDFCDEVAYAIPVSNDFYNGDESWEELMAAYDNYSESIYAPFEYAMQQIPCDTEPDAAYSPIRTCDDCKYSYKQWLCAVTIPRCISQVHAGSQNKFYSAGSGRNSFVADTINPPLAYAEVLPCLNVCQAIVRDCPSVFGFACPEVAELVKLSYGDPNMDNDGDDTTQIGISVTTDSIGSVETYRVCNYIGESNLITSTSS